MSEPNTYLYDAFISSSPVDRWWIETTLMPRLRTAGLRIVLSKPLGVFDSDARTFITEQIAQSHYVIAVLSPASLSDQQATFERNLALERNFREGVFCLLPVQIAPIEPSQLPTQLALLSTVDFTLPEKIEAAFAYLLSMWQPTQERIP
jgi:hypothetical protein